MRPRDLLSLTKPGVTAQVLLTTAGGYFLAPGSASLLRLGLLLVATALVVGSAGTLNCWLERESDGAMARTCSRALPAGRVKPRVALVFGLIQGALGLPLLFAVHLLTGLVGALALSSYVCLYTPLKRHSATAMFVGALPGAAPPLLGWTAATGRLDAGGATLFALLYLWQIPHFLAIVMRRRAEYAAAGLPTWPAIHGPRSTAFVAVGAALLLLPVSLALAVLGHAGALYVVVAAVLGAVFLGRAIQGARSADADWGRRVFRDSLYYLTSVFAALFLDALA